MANTSNRTSRAKPKPKENPAITLNLRIKKILNDIIDVAYAEETPGARGRYKHFKIYIETNNRKSRHGEYRLEDSSIHVFNAYRDARMIAITCIHELAHHIDRMKHGTTGHQKPFYDEYTKLLYAALNMRILTPDEDKDLYRDSSDGQKVRKIINAWVPAYVDYKGLDNRVVKVRNGYNQRDALKARGYRWNSVEQVWEKEISQEEEAEEQDFLQGLELEADLDKAGLMVTAMVSLYATGETYEVRSLLHQHGFRFNKEKKQWSKKVKSTEVKKEAETMNAMPEFLNVSFTYKK